MQESLDRAPMRRALESPTAQFSLNELRAPFEVLPLNLKDRLTLPLGSLMGRRSLGATRESFKPLLATVLKASPEFLDAAQTQAKSFGNLRDRESAFFEFNDLFASLLRCFFGHKRASWFYQEAVMARISKICLGGSRCPTACLAMRCHRMPGYAVSPPNIQVSGVRFQAVICGVILSFTET